MNLSVLYRGPLSSCNYGCHYCPFAKRRESQRQLQSDRDALARFTAWLERQTQHEWRVLFTPWGEALVRRWYREAIVALSQLPHVALVAVQTNLACGLAWLRACRPERVALWCTYHPTEVARDVFLAKLRKLRDWGVRVSVGMVGTPEAIAEIETVRRLLPDDVYLWINPQQPRVRPYTDAEVARLAAVDPLFAWAAQRKRSHGLECRAGETAFTVDGAGDIRRCHFVAGVIGNIQDPNWERSLWPRACPNQFCDCFLGRAQLEADALSPFFGETTIARLPAAGYSLSAPHVRFLSERFLADAKTDFTFLSSG